MSDPITIEPASRLLKEKEAAQFLSLETATLRRWRWSGGGPNYLKLGGAIRYELAAIEAFKEASRRASTSDVGPETATA
jgi:predicted DNA-binding transcriptional regulator AlpA